MELHLNVARWGHRQTDWLAAAVCGLAAGAVLMVVELFWAALVSPDSPWTTSRAIAAILIGREVLQYPGFDVGVMATALFTHYVLGVFFGLALGAILAQFASEWDLPEMMITGVLFGAALYLVNFYGMAQVFPWFGALRGWPAFVGHLIFGASAALIYWKLERRSTDR